MIKVLQVIGGLNRGGAETMLMNVYRCIDRTRIRFDFVVYSEKQQDYEAEIVSMGGRVLRVPSPSPVRPLESVSAIRKLLQQSGPYAAIHIHTLLNSIFPLLACAGNRDILKVVHSHSTQNTVSPSVTKRLYEWGARGLIHRLADVWLACGHDAGVYLFGKAFHAKGTILPNGIPLQTFTRDYSEDVAALKELFNIGNELVIGSIARLEPVKNHIHMLHIAARLKSRGVAFKMLFAGRGTLEAILKREAQRLRLEEYVLFLDIRQDIPQLLQLFDVFLMPSLFEGTPVALIEAQASQLPCLISSSIPDDADLKAGLIKKCELEADLNEWANMLLQHHRRKLKGPINIEAVFETSGYNVVHSAAYLQKLYLNHHA